MPLGHACQGKTWTRGRQAFQCDRAFEDHLWYHRAGLAEGTRALQRAQELAARFGLRPADSCTSEE
jgi:hypothetical protein